MSIQKRALPFMFFIPMSRDTILEAHSRLQAIS
jgi:hypothetical protein